MTHLAVSDDFIHRMDTVTHHTRETCNNKKKKTTHETVQSKSTRTEATESSTQQQPAGTTLDWNQQRQAGKAKTERLQCA